MCVDVFCFLTNFHVRISFIEFVKLIKKLVSLKSIFFNIYASSRMNCFVCFMTLGPGCYIDGIKANLVPF